MLINSKVVQARAIYRSILLQEATGAAQDTKNRPTFDQIKEEVNDYLEARSDKDCVNALIIAQYEWNEESQIWQRRSLL